MHKIAISTLLGAASAVALAGPAQALNNRTWISGHGVDQTGCGPVASPCRTLQFAHDNTAAGGEIDVLDGAGYGAIRITKAINVINEGAGVAGALAAADSTAITVIAGSGDDVVLRGLTIEGGGVGTDGIDFDSGGTLHIDKCSVQNFKQYGIFAGPYPTGRLLMTDTKVLNNKLQGILIGSGNVLGTLDHVVATHNDSGIWIVAPLNAIMQIQINNSVASYNAKEGIHVAAAAGGTVNVTIRDAFISGSYTGLVTSGAPLVFLDRTSITSNNYGVDNPGSTALYTLKTNMINGNYTSDFTSGSTLNPKFSLQ